jgi:hypothetical protein
VVDPLSVGELGAFLSRLGDPLATDDEADMIKQITLLERIKGACAARQARLTVSFDSSQRARQRRQGIPAVKAGRGVAEQIALARRESPARGAKHLLQAKALVGQMPNTLAALAAGDIGEWAAGLAVTETACLSPVDRALVDSQLAERLPTMSPMQVRGAAWAAACRLDPAAAVKRNAKAVNERHVSVRPAPEGMTYLTALLPMKEGVACFAALHRAAGAAAAAGDARGRGRVMADTLVERLTGQGSQTASASASSGAGATGGQPGEATQVDGPGGTVEVHLVMTDAALLAGGDDPALVTADLSGSNPAAGMVPAPVARDLVRQAAKVFVRRLYTDPESGQLVAMESSRRVFDGHLRRMLILRDGTCRTPWCDAPVRHADHVTDHADGGPTDLANGQGLCERCNQTKNLPGWTAETLDGGPGRHVVRTTTPTGHTYDSTAPPLLLCLPATSLAASPRRRPPRSSVEATLAARTRWHAPVAS